MKPWRHKLHEVIFEADTAPGRWFDTLLIISILMLAVIFGAIMYVVEGAQGGFTSIPRSIYWTIVTMTTVGFGDITPRTPLGQFLASIIMIIGYGIIAVPTGIVTVELAQSVQRRISTQACPSCSAEGHDYDARHCKFCGHQL